MGSILVRIVLGLVNAYSVIILIYVIMSWVPSSNKTFRDIQNVFSKLVDPYLNLFRKFIPPIGGMVDISPIIALLVLQLVARIIIWIF